MHARSGRVGETWRLRGRVKDSNPNGTHADEMGNESMTRYLKIFLPVVVAAVIVGAGVGFGLNSLNKDSSPEAPTAQVPADTVAAVDVPEQSPEPTATAPSVADEEVEAEPEPASEPAPQPAAEPAPIEVKEEPVSIDRSLLIHSWDAQGSGVTYDFLTFWENGEGGSNTGGDLVWGMTWSLSGTHLTITGDQAGTVEGDIVRLTETVLEIEGVGTYAVNLN